NSLGPDSGRIEARLKSNDSDRSAFVRAVESGWSGGGERSEVTLSEVPVASVQLSRGNMARFE
ncbi:hypothetical protein, partial [Variovorax sp. GT1P44]|uniref:hypothetical protein n=1 Tax=Variovorax sp. GT1P44 TaxID=3443742 RepID=UPI003F463690